MRNGVKIRRIVDRNFFIINFSLFYIIKVDITFQYYLARETVLWQKKKSGQATLQINKIALKYWRI